MRAGSRDDGAIGRPSENPISLEHREFDRRGQPYATGLLPRCCQRDGSAAASSFEALTTAGLVAATTVAAATGGSGAGGEGLAGAGAGAAIEITAGRVPSLAMIAASPRAMAPSVMRDHMVYARFQRRRRAAGCGWSSLTKVSVATGYWNRGRKLTNDLRTEVDAVPRVEARRGASASDLSGVAAAVRACGGALPKAAAGLAGTGSSCSPSCASLAERYGRRCQLQCALEPRPAGAR